DLHGLGGADPDRAASRSRTGGRDRAGGKGRTDGRGPGMSGPAPSGEAALAREFEAQRPRLLRLAYASTGSLAEAEDCVQAAWLRLQPAAGRDTIRDLGAWLTMTVSRLALDALGSARGRRERYAGPG